MKATILQLHILVITCLVSLVCRAADTTPPSILSVGSIDGNSIAVCFSEPLNPTTATAIGNYAVNGAIAPASVALRSDGATVVLTLGTAISGLFSVTANNVRDLADNVVGANSSANGTALGLTVVDVGSPSPPSDLFSCDGDTITVTAGGNDIWVNRDQFNFVGKAVEGDFDVQVRVTRLDFIGNWNSKAGLMMRETLDPKSRQHILNVNPQAGANQYEALFREFEGGFTASWGGAFGVSFPDGWMRLQRQGDMLTAYRSTDGMNWEQIAQTVPSIPYPPIIWLGLATCGVQAQGAFAATTASYDSLSLTASTPNHPFVRSASPMGGGARADAPVRITLQDGVAQVNLNSIELSVDGVAVTPTVSKSGNITTIVYESPTVFAAGSGHTVELSYTDTATPPAPGSFSFSFTVAHYVGPNGNLYEIVLAPAIPWENAKAAAEQRTYLGRNGHLATIANAEEDVFIQSLIEEAGLGGAAGEIWAGAFQLPNQADRTEGWMWVNNEGPVPGFNFGGIYANWFGFEEPNDCCVTTFFEDNEENYLGLGFFGTLGWNDDGPTHLNNVGGYVVEYDRLVVPLDIKPGAAPNSINIDAPGKLPVAVLSTASFNAATIDPATVRFGRTGTETAPLKYSLEDVNGDGRKDLVCQFEILETGLICGDTSAVLTAYTREGVPVKGTDSVNIVRCAPYTLSLQALQDVNKVTDLYVNVNVIAAGFTAPTLAQNLQLKSFDIFSKLRWTKNLNNLALAIGPGNVSSAKLQYTDMEHGQKAKGKMTVKDSSGRMQVLYQETRVLFRPDLALTDVVAPAQTSVRHIVNISATVRELKGDLGANANVYLLDGETVIDSVNGITVNALGEVTVVLAASFSQAGTHSLKLVVGNVTPGEYDSSNNEHSINIEVVQPALQAASYCLNYYRNEYEYESVADNPYWISTYHQRSAYEYLNERLVIPVEMQSPVGRIAMQITVDGVEYDNLEALNMPLFVYYEDGCYRYSSGSTFVGNNAYVYIQTSRDCFGFEQTYVEFQKYADTYVYFSSYYDKVWGTLSESSYNYGSGTFLNATSSVETRFLVESGEGAFGGQGAINQLFVYPYSYEWDYFDFETHYTGFERGVTVSGSNCDITTP
jgi:hypothetical protein